jgi:putative ABC transport system permease protein
MSKIGMYVTLPREFSEAYKLIKAVNNNYMYHSTEISKNIYLVSNIFDIFAMAIKWVALILAVFSVFLLINFVAHSIMQRQKEIGLFRAIGASGVDITKIFLLEAGVMLCGVVLFAILFMWLGTIGLNSLLVSGFMGYLNSVSISKISLLSMGLLSVLFMVFVTIIIGLMGVVVPLMKFIKMKPIDVIKRR